MIVPEMRLPYDERIPLGTWVSYTHRAAVARYHYRHRNGRDYGVEGWVLHEGVDKDEWYHDPGEKNPNEFLNGEQTRFMFLPKVDSLNPLVESVEPKRRPGRENKSVFVWPQDGTGMVIGLVRRACGYGWSESGSFSTWDEYDSYEPGGFDTKYMFWLYAVKTGLSGVRYSFVPPWAVTVLDGIPESQEQFATV